MKKLLAIFVILFIITSVDSITAQFNPDSLQIRISRIVKNYVDTNSAGMVIGVIRKEGNTPVIERRYSFGHIRKDTTSPRPDSMTISHRLGNKILYGNNSFYAPTARRSVEFKKLCRKSYSHRYSQSAVLCQPSKRYNQNDNTGFSNTLLGIA